MSLEQEQFQERWKPKMPLFSERDGRKFCFYKGVGALVWREYQSMEELENCFQEEFK